MSNKLILITVTARRSTEHQSFYTNKTEKGNHVLIGTITDCEAEGGARAPEWLTDENCLRTATITGSEKYIGDLLQSMENQYQNQLLNGVTDPVVDVIVAVAPKHLPMPTMSINPTDNMPSSAIILQAPEVYSVERGTSITLGREALEQVLAATASITNTRAINAYQTSMAAREVRNNKSDVVTSSTKVSIPVKATESKVL